MRKLIPDFIISRHQQGQLTGSLQAGILNVDIKGITALTQALMSRSHTGVEVLTDTVNALFSPAIEAIECLGGFISGFAGDAFTAIFPASEAEENSGFSNSDLLSAAIRIRDSVVTQGKQITEFGEFELEVRIGVASGDVHWSIVDTGTQAAYWFCGAGIQKAVLAQEIAQINEVIVEKDLCKQLETVVCQSTLRDDKFCCLEQLNPLAEPRDCVQNLLNTDAFVPKEIYDLSSDGEFRILLSSFINLSDPQPQQVIALIQTAQKMGGYLSHIDCTDKGWVAYVMFGAPLGYEKISLRAMDFALEVQNMCGQNARIGLSQGKAFTGFIGSKSRAEYTGMGMAVNLAARFMANAEWGDVCFDETIRKELSNVIATESLGVLKYKGFPLPIATFRFLSKHQDKMHPIYQNVFVGRNEELDTLYASCQPLFAGRFAGVCYIYGEAGQGKSRLVYELVRIFGDKVQCFELQTDSIQKNALNPFSYWLRQQFTSLQTISIDKRRDEFRSSWADFIAKIRNIPNTEKITSELERVESILAGLIGLEWEGSIYTNLDSKYRPTATGFALKALLEAFCLLTPLLLIIEDIHWLDKESEEVITILTRRASATPYKLILTARPFDDGKLPALNFDNDISEQTISLNGLNPGQVETVINSLLSKNTKTSNPVKAGSEFAEYVHAIAQGNPFIVEQLTRYLIETEQLLVKDNHCSLNARTDALPSGVQAILVARLDRLEAELKHTVQTASVLGREFAVDILSEMLGILENRPDHLNEIVVRSQLYAGEQEHIWNSLSEINYIFSHSLLREAAYAMQLKKQIMQLHLLAAEVMEKHYAKDNTKLSEIATHFFNAGENRKAVQYYDLCSENEYRKGNYLDAVKWSRKSRGAGA